MRTRRFFPGNEVAIGTGAERRGRGGGTVGRFESEYVRGHKKRLRILDIAVCGVPFDLCLKYINLRSLLHILLYAHKRSPVPDIRQCPPFPDCKSDLEFCYWARELSISRECTSLTIIYFDENYFCRIARFTFLIEIMILLFFLVL